MKIHRCRNSNPINDFHVGTALHTEKSYPVWMIWKRRRYVVATMAFFGFSCVYALRVVLSIAIVAMTATTEVVHIDGTITQVPGFDWDSKVQGYVLSSFFYGYIVTQLAGGWLAAKYGGKYVYGIGIAVTGVLTIISPFAAKQSYYFLIALRVVEGLFEGVTYPGIHAVWAEWAPPLERSRLAAIGFSGSYAGTVVTMVVSPLISNKLGWEAVFYVFGCMAVLWFLCWCKVVADSPSNDRYISDSELSYIKNSLGEQQVSRIVKHPWKSIATSIPVWAIIVATFSEDWGLYTLLTQLPTFMKDTLHFELASTGVMAGIPYLVMAVTTPIAGKVADSLLEREIFNITQVRKICNYAACIGPAVFLLAAAYLISPVGTTICMSVAVGMSAFKWSGYGINHLDIAPQHASVLMGISNTFGTIPGIVSPIISGYIVTTPTDSQWQTVFIISSCIYILGGIFYGVFASGELEPWAVHMDKTKDDGEQRAS
ncbi:hypothetical protein RI129_004551 [Pyrocoelia pectoralis]|uniref:Sialin n=1 Tax=Pyrocoelia pectoralis TaxID=417401 RepID=A0AAN7ZKM0_9COLE